MKSIKSKINDYFKRKLPTSILGELDKIIGDLQQIEITVTYPNVDNRDQVEKLNSKEYVEVAPGVWDRLLVSKDDIKFDFEEVIRSYIQDLNYSNNYIVIVRSYDGAHFAYHYHPFDETFIIVSGEYSFWKNHKTKIGEIIKIPANKEHMYSVLESGITLIIIPKEQAS